ncbi:hypothetical protein [Dokdonella sp.]|uniref:hypothetical protein n=1 Tax=Dokdonella sp. TaxID=2291710 RepID=UPI0035296083
MSDRMLLAQKSYVEGGLLSTCIAHASSTKPELVIDQLSAQSADPVARSAYARCQELDLAMAAL